MLEKIVPIRKNNARGSLSTTFEGLTIIHKYVTK